MAVGARFERGKRGAREKEEIGTGKEGRGWITETFWTRIAKIGSKS
jgi:hypothetical protein